MLCHPFPVRTSSTGDMWWVLPATMSFNGLIETLFYTLQPELLLLRNKNVAINYCEKYILMMCKTDFGLIYGINTQEMKC